jgi:hypothetical protein
MIIADFNKAGRRRTFIIIAYDDDGGGGDDDMFSLGRRIFSVGCQPSIEKGDTKTVKLINYL